MNKDLSSGSQLTAHFANLSDQSFDAQGRLAFYTKGEFGTIDYVDMANVSEQYLIYGKISAACGKAAMQFIERAADLALSQQVKSIVTAPINKEATQLAGEWSQSGAALPLTLKKSPPK